ncbi:hypothetical protein SAMN04489737_0577 [Arcanobacterium phocae]|uniref:Uncharacterized protein n=1 Tax=Arcanobacterium phocae TaxID=131112 RepID=A0A1H2LCG9_9ACTO|nr:hypothetical protein [Arcanobacterium phocae]SDU78693.1 hypothetical protein SAMN04489737_0577 [Arcanobacterium phocae]
MFEFNNFQELIEEAFLEDIDRYATTADDWKKSGGIAIFCNAKRSFHSKKEKRWLALFSPVSLEPKTWGTVLLPRKREYEETIKRVLLDNIPYDIAADFVLKKVERSAYGEDDTTIFISDSYHDVDYDIPLSEALDVGLVDENDLASETGDNIIGITPAKFYNPRIITPADIALEPELTNLSQFFNGVLPQKHAGRWVYELNCPCRRRYRAISDEELSPVLDQLKEHNITEISASSLIKAIDLNKQII